MYTQVRELQRLGIDAHVVCELTENLGFFYVEGIHCLDDEPFLVRAWDKGLRKLRFRRHLNYLANIGEVIGAQIIHSHFGHLGWANLGAIRKPGQKHVVTFYGFDVNQLPAENPAWRQRYRRMFAEVDRVLCEGSFMAESIVNLGCQPDKVKVHHLGVAVDKIDFQARQWHRGEPLRVLIAASFREKKGIPFAIAALEIISRNVPVQLTIIGDAGDDPGSQLEKTKILDALDRSQLLDQTRLLGYQPHQVLLDEAYEHHVFLQPSVTAQNGDTEGGAPVSIIEMLATGMPVVATTHCDIPEVIGPAGSHLLAPERDAAALAECVESLIANPQEWAKLAADGRHHVERHYSSNRQAKMLIDHYDAVLSSR